MNPTSTEKSGDSWENWNDSSKVRLRHKLWRQIRRPAQTPPDPLEQVWYVRGGRGSGKTRTGAETLGEWISTYQEGDGDWAIVAPTFADARDTCVEGESGLLRVLAGQYERWNRSMGQIHLHSGAVVFCDGADDGALRIQGKNLRGVWCDEIGLWRITQSRDRQRLRGVDDELEVQAWDESIMFAVRKDPALIVVTGTPKRGHILVRRLINDPTVHKTQMRMEDNAKNLAPAVVDRLVRKYGDTALGRQELGGEFIDEIEGALWRIAQIDASRMLPDTELRLARIVVGVDPPGGATECGISVAGIIAGMCPCGVTDNLPHAAVIADASLVPSGPNHWATAALTEYHDRKADRIYGETNYGGDMVINTIRNLDSSAPVDKVTATRGKIVRAEPIASLYGDPARPETWARSRVHHVGRFPELEDELTSFAQDQAGLWSPNRLDAMVWALTALGMGEWRQASTGARQLANATI